MSRLSSAHFSLISWREGLFCSAWCSKQSGAWLKEDLYKHIDNGGITLNQSLSNNIMVIACLNDQAMASSIIVPMVTSLKYYLLIICAVLCCSCNTKNSELSATVNPKQLTSVQILELIEDAAFKPYGSNNFHVFYEEFLNDSTWVLYIIQNDFLGNDTLGICQVLDFHERHVFIYGDSCKMKLNEDIKSKNGGPFQYDGASRLLLVENRSGRLGYFTLKKRVKFDVITEPIDSNIIEIGKEIDK